MARARYEIRLMYRLPELLAVLAAWTLIGVAYANVMQDLPPGARARGVLAMLETALPLVALFAVGHAASIEWEERTAELSLSYRGGSFGILGHRLAIAGALLVAVTILSVAAFAALMPEMLKPGQVNAFRVGLTAVPPALLIGSASLLASIVGRGYLAGLAAGLALWGLDILLPGKLTGPLYLFQASRPVSDLGLSLSANRIALCLLAALVLGAALVLWSRRERVVG